MDRHLEGASDRLELQKGDIPLAALYARHVRAVQSGSVGEFFLGQSPSDANLADSVPDLSEQGLQGPGHAPMVRRVVDYSSRDYSPHDSGFPGADFLRRPSNFPAFQTRCSGQWSTGNR